MLDGTSLKNRYIFIPQHQRQFWLNATIATLLFIPILSFSMHWQKNFLQQATYYNAHAVIQSLTLVFIAWMIGAPVLLWLSEKIKQRRLLISTSATITSVLLAIIIYVPSLSPHTMTIVLCCLGFFSSVQGVIFSLLNSFSPHSSWRIGFMLAMMITLMGFLAMSGLRWLLHGLWLGEWVNHAHYYRILAYQESFFIVLVCALLSVLLSFFIDETVGSG